VIARGVLVALLIVACGHDERSAPPPVPPATGSAAEHLQQALTADGIHQRGDTHVDAGSLESFARSFVAVLSSGDQRAALSLLHGKVWDYDCSSEAGRTAAENLGGLLVKVPRNIRFAAVEPVGEPRTIAKGERLGGCAVTADTTVQVVHVTWTAPAGDATLEVARARDRDWTLTAIHDQ
jgi:hypothetical protein